jgi:cell division protein FtsQ
MRFLTRDRDRTAPRRARPPRRRIATAGAAAALALALASAGWWLYRSEAVAHAATAAEQRALAWTAHCGLAIADIEVQGRQRASREAVLDALGVVSGTPILALDPAAAKRRLETIPWIRSAAVERRLPDTLYVQLRERQPLALWQRQGRLMVVDRDGVAISGERPEDFANLIVLVGNDAPLHGAALLDMLAREPSLAGHVAAAVRIGGRRWNLRLDNGIDVALPEEDAAGAWRRLAELERSDGILERDLEMVDLRLPDRLVLRSPEPQKPAKKPRQPGKTT